MIADPTLHEAVIDTIFEPFIIDEEPSTDQWQKQSFRTLYKAVATMLLSTDPFWYWPHELRPGCNAVSVEDPSRCAFVTRAWLAGVATQPPGAAPSGRVYFVC